MGSPITFLIVRKLLRLLGIGPTSSDDKDVEIAVLGHQLAVIRRQVARPRFCPSDHALLAALAHMAGPPRISVTRAGRYRASRSS